MKFIILILFVLSLMLNSCQASFEQTNIDSIVEAEQITQLEAIDIVRQAVQKYEDVDTMQFEFEGTQSINSVDYYRVHAYSVSSQELVDNDGNSYFQSFTYEWFFVNTTNGKIYIEDLSKLPEWCLIEYKKTD